MAASRIAILVLALTALAFASGTALAQAERYAVFVADMETGEVLHARRADAPRFPASLTKMMTLYMLFEAERDGRITLDDMLPVSAEAASRPASRLGLAEGAEIRAEDAVRALIIASANDVAVVVAEHLGGTETAFAEAMTERARRLGLTATTFRNASGLPDPLQRTTARDMARLAYALQRDFPERYHYFAETRFAWNGRSIPSHNTLVGNMRGVDGLKTGYIRASGFNVALTAGRHERRLVAIIMGGASPAVRDAHARELLEAAFATLDARDQGRLLARLDVPRLNPIREQELLTAELAGLPGRTEQGSARSAPPVRVELADADSLAAPAAPAPEISVLSLPRGWSIQVGAYGSEAAARARLETVSAMGLEDLISGARYAPEPLERGATRLWRARFAGLDVDAARAACARLQARGEACFTVAPDA
ncbi:D-alanyl-D-alanine carboxypeptidase [Alkalicaulis satelles]|uniref:D-alanyl-D-alanine carboxypeptidase n=1 Tax=Alkalicaulis satelles TaxID=2609175 RepID=A0A5M6ZM69_9PROT|nr:D-alanyl-D-alanine carboxypeptidase [Alkalicaulis satelles]KAA5804995.1 D-alanyl-D-alanine carboxypeptidase [Alkalicaulis satelles]